MEQHICSKRRQYLVHYPLCITLKEYTVWPCTTLQCMLHFMGVLLVRLLYKHRFYTICEYIYIYIYIYI